MTSHSVFFVSYEEELARDDQDALTRPGWKFYPNGIGSTAAYRGEEMPPVRYRQVVRVPAEDAREAMRLVTEALGREPERLRAHESKVADE